MKKIFYIIIFSIILIPNLVFAAPNINVYTEKIATGAGYDKATETSLSETIGKYIKIALSFVGTIFLALTVYAGFLWMTASGNEDQVTKAKDILQMATIGLVIAISAFSITSFVVSKTTSSAQQPQAPLVGGNVPQNSNESFWSNWMSGFNKQSSQPL